MGSLRSFTAGSLQQSYTGLKRIHLILKDSNPNRVRTNNFVFGFVKTNPSSIPDDWHYWCGPHSLTMHPPEAGQAHDRAEERLLSPRLLRLPSYSTYCYMCNNLKLQLLTPCLYYMSEQNYQYSDSFGFVGRIRKDSDSVAFGFCSALVEQCTGGTRTLFAVDPSNQKTLHKQAGLSSDKIEKTRHLRWYREVKGTNRVGNEPSREK